jgi:hypothetical protein
MRISQTASAIEVKEKGDVCRENTSPFCAHRRRAFTTDAFGSVRGVSLETRFKSTSPMMVSYFFFYIVREMKKIGPPLSTS